MSQVFEVDVGGMTCASCVARVEKALNQIEGVEASVNLATEKALIEGKVDAELIISEIKKIGYSASLLSSSPDIKNGNLDYLLPRLIFCSAATVPVLVLSMVPSLQFVYWQWIALSLALPASTWGAWPFYRAAFFKARVKSISMDTLVALGVGSSLIWSLYSLVFGSAGDPGMTMSLDLFGNRTEAGAHIYLEVSTAVTTFMLLGRFVELRTKKSSAAVLRSLIEAEAKFATVIRKKIEVRVPVSDVRLGDLMVIRAGERIPVDGEVIDGTVLVDSALMTGESLPKKVSPGKTVLGGTIVLSGILTVRATRLGDATELARIRKMVEAAQSRKSSAQRIVDAISGFFVPTIIAVAGLAFVGWMVLDGNLSTAFQSAIATLIISCPCALGLATPLALLVASGRGAQLGLIISGPEALEHSKAVETIVLDKTGTLTVGAPHVSTVVFAPTFSEEEILACAASVGRGSTHPLSLGINQRAQELNISVPRSTRHRVFAGLGVQAEVMGSKVAVGKLSWLIDTGFETADWLELALKNNEMGEDTAVAVGVGSKITGLIVLSDSLRLSSRRAVEKLRTMGLNLVIASGDSQSAVSGVARSLEIPKYEADLSPAQKTDLVQRLQSQGQKVAMVGDGINDSAALASADLGIAVGSGTDMARKAADLVISSSDLLGVVDAIRLARRTNLVIRGNLFWAFFYNIASIPIAVSGTLSPVLAGFAMVLSSLFVSSNSLSLRGFRPTKL